MTTQSDNFAKKIRRLGVALLIGTGLLTSGCSTNLNEILFESAAATGRTSLDLWLTAFENRLADVLDPNPT